MYLSTCGDPNCPNARKVKDLEDRISILETIRDQLLVRLEDMTKDRDRLSKEVLISMTEDIADLLG